MEQRHYPCSILSLGRTKLQCEEQYRFNTPRVVTCCLCSQRWLSRVETPPNESYTHTIRIRYAVTHTQTMWDDEKADIRIAMTHWKSISVVSFDANRIKKRWKFRLHAECFENGSEEKRFEGNERDAYPREDFSNWILHSPMTALTSLLSFRSMRFYCQRLMLNWISQRNPTRIANISFFDGSIILSRKLHDSHSIYIVTSDAEWTRKSNQLVERTTPSMHHHFRWWNERQ